MDQLAANKIKLSNIAKVSGDYPVEIFKGFVQ